MKKELNNEKKDGNIIDEGVNKLSTVAKRILAKTDKNNKKHISKD